MCQMNQLVNVACWLQVKEALDGQLAESQEANTGLKSDLDSKETELAAARQETSAAQDELRKQSQETQTLQGTVSATEKALKVRVCKESLHPACLM